MAEAGRRAARVPDSYPAVSELVVGMDGSTWVRGTEKEEGYLVFDSSGYPRGRVRIPPNRQILFAKDTLLWVMEEDQWGVESISHYRVLGFVASVAGSRPS